MNRCIKRCLTAGMFVGGAWILGSGIASADAPATGHHSAITMPISAPVTVSGNAVAVLGRAGNHLASHPVGGSSAHPHSSRPAHSTHGTASGGSRPGTAHRSSHSRPVLYAPVYAPVTVCGNAVGVLGRANASCVPATSSGDSRSGSGGSDTSGSKAGVYAPVTAPVTVCGNAVGHARATCGAPAGSPPATPGSDTSGSKAGVYAPVTVPVTVCGNAVGILGSGRASCSVPGGMPASPDGHGTVFVPVTAPVTVCGNAGGMIGSGTATCTGPAAEVPGTPASPAPQSPTPQSPTPQSPAPQFPAPPASAIEPISSQRGPGQQVGGLAAGNHQAALASSGRSLAFTGASIALPEVLGLGLLLTGFALCLVRRRSTA